MSHPLIGKQVQTPAGPGLVVSVRHSGGVVVELAPGQTRQFGPDDVRPVVVKCIHCGGPSSFGVVCDSCLVLLADLEEEDDTPAPAPAPTPRPRRPGHFEPSQADLEAYREMVAAGAFEPAAPSPRHRPPRSLFGWSGRVR